MMQIARECYAELCISLNPSFPRPLGSVSGAFWICLQLTRVQRGCSLGAHLKVFSKGINWNKSLDSFLLAQCLPGSLSKPNAKQRWEASINCSEGGWKSGGGREKVVRPAMHSSCFMPDRFPQIQRSALKHRCVRKRGRVRRRVIRVAIYSASTKTPVDLEQGPGCLWKRRIHQRCFVSRNNSGCKCHENNWVLL